MIKGNNWATSREKVPNVLSRRHTKRRIGAYDPDFLDFFSFEKKKNEFLFLLSFFFFFFLLKSGCHTKRRVSVPLRPLGTFSLGAAQI